MVSDFRKKKLLRGFKILDADKSGNIEKADFDLAVERIKKIRGWSDGEERVQKIADFMTKFWNGIQAQADADNDGKVTEDEWIQMWDEYSKNPGPLEWQEQYARFSFDMLDDGYDGIIDRDEFVSVLTRIGRTAEEAEDAFEKISGGKSSLSFEDFLELWKEYFSADDIEAAGNYIFGPPNAEVVFKIDD